MAVIDDRIAKARITGYYEPLREKIEEFAAQGYSQRYTAMQMNMSRQTIVIASRALGIEFTPRKDVPMGQHRRRMREFKVKMCMPTHTPRPNLIERTLIDFIRAYTAQWDRGW